LEINHTKQDFKFQSFLAHNFKRVIVNFTAPGSYEFCREPEELAKQGPAASIQAVFEHFKPLAAK
jgi:hypothetical protein